MTARTDVADERPQSTNPSSRRSLLTAAAAGLGAWIVSGLGRVAPVRAEGENIVVGGEYTTATSVTRLRNETNNETVLSVEKAGNGLAIDATSAGVAIRALSSGANGAIQAGNPDGIGVDASSGTGVAVLGITHSTVRPAIIGNAEHNAGGTGVMGLSGAGTQEFQLDLTNIGVYGEALHDALSRGVYGRSRLGGFGVVGESVTGTALSGIAPANSGYALQASGRTSFSRSGRTTFAANTSAQVISISLLTSASIVLATVQGNVAGTWVEGVSIDTANGTFTIRLNKKAMGSVVVGWFVLN